jgi:hypothetical protein
MGFATHCLRPSFGEAGVSYLQPWLSDAVSDCLACSCRGFTEPVLLQSAPIKVARGSCRKTHTAACARPAIGLHRGCWRVKWVG